MKERIPIVRPIKIELANPNFFRLVPGLRNSKDKWVFPLELRQKIIQLMTSPAAAKALLEAFDPFATQTLIKIRTEPDSKQQARYQQKMLERIIHPMLQLIELFAEAKTPQIRVVAIDCLLKTIVNANIKATISLGTDEGYPEKNLRSLAERTIPIIRKLSTFPPEQSTPQHCRDLLQMVHSIFADANPIDQRVAATIYGGIVREKMALQFFDNNPRPIESAEYRMDALEDSPVHVQGILLNYFTLDEQHKIPLWVEILKRMNSEPDLLPSEAPIERALFDQTDPQHRAARRIYSKMLFFGHPALTMPHLFAAAAYPDGIPEKGAKLQHIAQSIQTPSGTERLEVVRQLAERLGGASARQIFIDYQRELLPWSTRPQQQRIAVRNPLILQEHIRAVTSQLPDEVQPKRRIVEVYSEATIDSATSIPRINERARQPLASLSTAMSQDVMESRVAIKNLTRPVQLPDWPYPFLMEVMPLAERFPACAATFCGEEQEFSLSLDEELRVVQSGTILPAGHAFLECLRAYVIAGLHDALTVRGVRAQEMAAHQPAEPFVSDTSGADETAPARSAPERVRKIGNFLVIAPPDMADDDLRHAKVSIMADDNGMKVRIDRSPHWADLAPQLTRAARGMAWQHIVEQHNIPQAYIELFQAALEHPAMHRLTLRALIYKIYDEFHHRHPNGEVPLAHMLATGQAVEQAEYQRLFAEYTNAPIRRLARFVDERMQKDAERMQALGVHYSVPPRDKESLTYRPFSRFEQWVQLNPNAPTARLKGFTIMPAGSAIKAVERLVA